jgi:tRNA pseudouridine55 synthase
VIEAAAPIGSAGVLLVDKPIGPTSHDIVDHVRRALRTRRVGHTGTLDPFASGLLVVCVGNATRLSRYLTGLDKEYLAVVRLGASTSTDDTEGEITGQSEAWIDLCRDALEAALDGLRGEILQVPPEFSAKKVGGEAAHRKARRGERVSLAAVPVAVRRLDLLDAELPDLRLRIVCSSGTYIRALARDLGAALGVGGHLVELRRTRVGAFRVEDAVRPDGDVANPPSTAWLEPSVAMSHMAAVRVDALQAKRLANGQSIPLEAQSLNAGEHVAVLLDEELVAVAVAEPGRVSPQVVLVGGGG